MLIHTETPVSSTLKISLHKFHAYQTTRQLDIPVVVSMFTPLTSQPTFPNEMLFRNLDILVQTVLHTNSSLNRFANSSAIITREGSLLSLPVWGEIYAT